MDVSKLGLWTKGAIQIRLKITGGTGETLSWSNNLLAATVSNIELATASRTIVSMSGEKLSRRINRSKHRSVYHRRGGYGWANGGGAP